MGNLACGKVHEERDLTKRKGRTRPQGSPWIFSPLKQGNGPSSRDEDREPGLFVSCGGTLGVPLEGRRGCRGTSLVTSRM